jgi:hypothetical protein
MRLVKIILILFLSFVFITFTIYEVILPMIQKGDFDIGFVIGKGFALWIVGYIIYYLWTSLSYRK